MMRRRWLFSLAALALLLAIFLTGQAIRSYRSLQHGREHLEVAVQLVKDGDYGQSASRFSQADRSFRTARQRVRGFPSGFVGRIPIVGSPWAALADAASAAKEVVAAGRLVSEEAESLSRARSALQSGQNLAGLAAPLQEARRTLVAASERLTRSSDILDGPAGALIPVVSGKARGLRQSVIQLRKQLNSAANGAALLEGLVARGSRAKLLVLAQDTLELRPTGGFVGSFGILSLSDGTVALERYQSFAELPAPSPPLNPPNDLAMALGRAWDLSNSLWWPDFPTSAANAREMFRRQGGGDIDGVVAITEQLMQRLVAHFGSVEVPGYETVIPDGFADRIVYEVELKRPPDVPQKRFLTLLAQAVFDRVLQAPGDDLPVLSKIFADAAGLGDIQVWFTDPTRRALLGSTSWASRLPRTNRDFLMLVDANLTASKANAHLERRVTYTVGRDARGRLKATLEVLYRNTGPESSINRYYNGFLRIYVPLAARLIDADAARDDGAARDGPYRVFSVRPYVLPGSTDRLTISYWLPDSVAPQSRYGLTWVRQVGTRNDELRAVIGGRTHPLPATTRVFSAERELRRNRVLEFLRTRRFWPW